VSDCGEVLVKPMNIMWRDVKQRFSLLYS
jgi:hypothetical protein